MLSAVGIEANIEGRGLEDLGVKTKNGKIIVDDFYRTNVLGVYAIGDILPTQALAHVASAEGIICVEKITGHNPEVIDYERSLPLINELTYFIDNLNKSIDIADGKSGLEVVKILETI